MKREVVSATEAARSFSSLLNRVRYDGQEFEIKRGHEIVARLVPAGPSAEFPVSRLNELFAELPKLDESDVERFADEIRSIRRLRPDWPKRALGLARTI